MSEKEALLPINRILCTQSSL